MKRRSWIILIILACILLLFSWFIYKNWNTVISVWDSFRYSQEEVEQKMEENQKELQEFIDQSEDISVRPLTPEEEKALQEGSLSEEDAILLMTGQATEQPKENPPPDKPDEEKPQQNPGGKKEEPKPEQPSAPPPEPEETHSTEKDSGQKVAELIAKLYVQKSIYLEKLDDIEAHVRAVYIAMTKEEQKTAKKDLLAQYLPEVSAWEKTCDSVVYGIIDEIQSELKKSGQDESIADKIKASYLDEKSLKKSYFINRYMD